MIYSERDACYPERNQPTIILRVYSTAEKLVELTNTTPHIIFISSWSIALLLLASHAHEKRELLSTSFTEAEKRAGNITARALLCLFN
jgi:hypothetical protein